MAECSVFFGRARRNIELLGSIVHSLNGGNHELPRDKDENVGAH